MKDEKNRELEEGTEIKRDLGSLKGY